MSLKKQIERTVEETHATSGCGTGNEEEHWLERGDHPLLNDLILNTLFGFVRRCDLKACRVVDNKWNFHTIPNMRATFRVTIHGSESDISNRQIDDFVKSFRKNKLGIPFSKFRLGPFCTTDGVGKQFLQLCGEIATEIAMDAEVFQVHTIEDVSELLRSCPNLKVFSFPSWVTSRSGGIVKLFPDSTHTFLYLKKISFRMDSKQRIRFCPTVIQELLIAAPNSSDIVSHTLEINEEEEVSTVSVVLNAIEKLGKQSSIQSLDLRYAGMENIERLERMSQNGLKLKSLNFEPQKGIGDFNRVQIQLATTFQDTLQHLKVEQFAENILMEYPKMPNLKSLCLRMFPNSDPKPVNLNENFPALETMDIGFEDTSEDWDEFFSQFFPCITLTALSVHRGNMRIHTFCNIQRVFPNLTKLDFKFEEDGNEILRGIWTHMTKLESLRVWGVVSGPEYLGLDSLFTGIPTETLKRIRYVVSDMDNMTVQKRRDTIQKLRSEHCSLPCVGNLTKLKHLELNVTGIAEVNKRKQSSSSFASEGMSDRQPFRLSDVTAYLALYSMNHLHRVEVRYCTFTKPCCEILTKETELQFWTFQGNYYEEDTIPPFVRHETENQ